MARALTAQGDQVFALDRTEYPHPCEGLVNLSADLKDPASLASIPQQWDGVIHLAGATIPSQFSSPALVTFNLEITLNLLEHLRDSRVLLVSSAHVYGNSSMRRQETDPIVPQGRYGLSKHLVEQLAPHFKSRLDIRIARPFNHLGPGQRVELVVPSLLQRLAALPIEDQSPVEMAGCNSVRDFIDVRDVVTAYLAILGMEGSEDSVFNVCTGRATSIAEVVKAVLELLGVQREIHFQGTPNSLDDTPYMVGDPERLFLATGWRPRWSLSESLRSMMEALLP
jgi:GDP-4-dehydro-6-deoxy-D-mannose reductase